jgi:hypothetical protein
VKNQLQEALNRKQRELTWLMKADLQEQPGERTSFCKRKNRENREKEKCS